MTLEQLYDIRELYSSTTMFSPPSERLGRVIRFELTKGCSWGRCSFCGGYDGQKHLVKSADEYKQHVQKVWELIGRRTWLARNLTRIFVGGGNALEVDGKELHELLAFTVKMFEDNTGYGRRRLSIYGRTADILKHGKNGLAKLRFGKSGFRNRLPGALDLVYWGVESGSDAVLSYVNKGCTQKQMVAAGECLRYASVDASVMIMTGLGGFNFYDQHVMRTAELLNEIRPRFVTFMGVNAAPCSSYARRMLRETDSGENRALTPKETATQMIEIIEATHFFGTKVGCFGEGIDSVGCNPLTFGSYQISNDSDRRYLVSYLRERLQLRFWREP